MADLAFLDKLDPEQLGNAKLLIEQSNSMGVDPRLALSLAYTESGLRQNKTGSKGEIGMMQIMPDTGKLLGYTPDDLKDVNTNAKAGLTYLKSSIEKLGNPQLGVIGYNAGPDHPFFTGQADSPPASSLEYVNKIANLGGFIPTEEVKQEVVPASEADLFNQKMAGTVPPVPLGIGDMNVNAGNLAVGAGAGALAGSATAPQIARGVQAVRTAAGVPPPSTGMSAGEKWARPVTGYVKPGETTVVGQAEAWNRAKGQGPVTGPISKKFGVTAPGQIGKLSVQSATGPLSQAGTYAGNLAGAALRSPMVSGALGGAGAGLSASEAYQRSQRGDPTGAMVAGIGGIGGLAALAPYPPLKAVGMATSIGSQGVLAAMDRMRSQQGLPPATPAEMQQAQKPSFAAQRP
jgi:hypothetical protein